MAGLFKEAVLTKKGISLLAKAQAGRCRISLTKAASGDGAYSDTEDVSARTELKSQKQAFPLETVTVQNDSNVFVKFVITNKQADGNLQIGYSVTEIGLFAEDPDEGEILYAIAVGIPGKCDYMPSYNDLLPSTITVNFLAEVANAENVAIEMPNEHYLYDEDTGSKYVLGIKGGLFYYEEVTG